MNSFISTLACEVNEVNDEPFNYHTLTIGTDTPSRKTSLQLSTCTDHKDESHGSAFIYDHATNTGFSVSFSREQAIKMIALLSTVI